MNIQPINYILKVTSILTVLLILLVSCNNATPQSVPQSALPGGLSPEAQEAVKDHILDAGEPGRRGGPCPIGGDIECRDFKAKCAKAVELSAADKTNGIEEKWCVHESYSSRLKPEGEWKDTLRPGEVLKRNGNWEVNFSFCECQ